MGWNALNLKVFALLNYRLFSNTDVLNYRLFSLHLCLPYIFSCPKTKTCTLASFSFSWWKRRRRKDGENCIYLWESIFRFFPLFCQKTSGMSKDDFKYSLFFTKNSSELVLGCSDGRTYSRFCYSLNPIMYCGLIFITMHTYSFMTLRLKLVKANLINE